MIYCYLYYSRKKIMPKPNNILRNVYDDSFVNRPFCGSVYDRNDEKQPISNGLIWPKCTDNPDAPDYVRITQILVDFYPFWEGYRYSKKMYQEAIELGYDRIAIFSIYNGFMKKNDYNFGMIDHRILHRFVSFFVDRLNGIVCKKYGSKKYSPKEYYETYKEFIDYPFNKILNEEDYKRMILKR